MQEVTGDYAQNVFHIYKKLSETGQLSLSYLLQTYLEEVVMNEEESELFKTKAFEIIKKRAGKTLSPEASAREMHECLLQFQRPRVIQCCIENRLFLPIEEGKNRILPLYCAKKEIW